MSKKMSVSTATVAVLSIRLPDDVLDKIRAIVAANQETFPSFIERAVGKFTAEVRSGLLDIRRPRRAWWTMSQRTMCTIKMPTAMKRDIEAMKHKVCGSVTSWILLAAIREIEISGVQKG